MNNKWLLLLVFGLFFLVVDDASAQTRRKSTGKKKRTTQKKEKTSKSDFWKEQVWYGGSMQLGFGGNQNYSQFVIGVTPMMGFKIKKTPFSVGPRVGVTYMSLKGTGSDGKVHRANLPAYTTSAFARVKFLQMFFLHTEYELEWKREAFVDNFGRLVIDSDDKVLTDKTQRDNFYVGAGYNSGGYEIMVLYNLNIPENSLEQPFSFRGGFTWNF